MQWSVRVNQAYQRLKDPLQRAAYLCERRGAPVRAERNTAMPRDFLMQQMAWREALDEAHDGTAVQALAAQVAQQQQALLARVEELLDKHNDAAGAAEQLRALMFVHRFGLDIDDRLESLQA
jgi:molecular chaperone HscB